MWCEHNFLCDGVAFISAITVIAMRRFGKLWEGGQERAKMWLPYWLNTLLVAAFALRFKAELAEEREENIICSFYQSKVNSMYVVYYTATFMRRRKYRGSVVFP